MDHIPEFEITTYRFDDKQYREWTFPYDYHYLYILENGKDAYVGETNDIIKRSKAHHEKADPCYPFRFRRIHVITGRDITATPAKHYENLLIKLMRIDRRFHIRNTDPGARTFYAAKNEFELGFDLLWVKLAERGLVRRTKFSAILNSSEYKYSPFTRLTEQQQQTLQSVRNALLTSDTQKQRNSKRTRPILIEGDAGSGKTVIAATLFHHLKHDPLFAGRKIGLVYANPATRKELQSVFRCVPGKDQKEILCPVAVTKEHYDIIICDEAQRLRRNQNLGMYTPHFLRGNARLGLGAGCDELDWMLTNSDDQVFLYDEKQIANPADIPAEQFRARLEVEQGGTRPVALRGQMRIRAGERYVPYIYDVLYQRADQTVSFDRYEFRLFSSFQAMHQRLREKEAEMGLCRLSSGYAWKWTSKEEPARPDIVLDGVGIWWNQQTGGWVRNDSAKGEMGSLYSLVGLDLNYAGVVIGPDLFYDRRERKIKVNRGQFFDNKVKSGVSEEDLLRYVLNTYATLLTRGIYGTYVYVCDQALRDYLRQYIPAFE